MKKVNKIGDKHFVQDIQCQIRYVNNGVGWLCPTTDDEDTPLIARHIAFAKIDKKGKITLL